MPTRDVVFPPQAARRCTSATAIRPPCAQRLSVCLGPGGQPRTARPSRPNRASAPGIHNLNAVLHAAGCTFDDVVDVTMFVVSPEANFETVWSVVPEFWGEAPPTLTGMG